MYCIGVVNDGSGDGTHQQLYLSIRKLAFDNLLREMMNSAFTHYVSVLLGRNGAQPVEGPDSRTFFEVTVPFLLFPQVS